MSVEVVNVNAAKRSGEQRTITYCGRGTVYGNYSANAHDESERDEACDAFADDFIYRVQNDPQYQQAMQVLADQHDRDGYLILGCHCKPRRCHLDTIAGYVQYLINKKK